MARHGDDLPVSALPVDGTYPTGTTQYEKRNVGQEIPTWDPDVCVQCGKCVMVCPHAVIRSKVYEPEQLENAPAAFKHTAAKDKAWSDLQFTIQVAAEDCTGCALCVEVCPAKNKASPAKKPSTWSRNCPCGSKSGRTGISSSICRTPIARAEPEQDFPSANAGAAV
jgi:pyruvate-ferredoxin/flavodoxin oxidoreductase